MSELDQSNVIYGLYCVCENCGDSKVIRYVGLTRGMAKKRLATHLKPCRMDQPFPVDRWKFKHGTTNIRMTVLEVVDPGEDLDAREVHWIAELRTCTDDRQGGLNRTRGGNSGLSEDSLEQLRRTNSRHDTTWARFSHVDVLDMRARYREGVPVPRIAEKFDTAKSHVWDILRNRTWIDPEYVFHPRQPDEHFRNPRNLSRKVTLEQSRSARVGYWSDPNRTISEVAGELGVSKGIAQRIIRNEINYDPTYEPGVRHLSDARKKQLSETLTGVRKPEGHGEKVSQAIRGEKHGMGKLSAEDVLEIRRLRAAGTPRKEVSERYGISTNHVTRLCAGGRWSHLEDTP